MPHPVRTVRLGSPIALGYCRVSTLEQEDSGLGLASQRAALRTEAEHRGWALEILTEQAMSGSTTDRPVLNWALDRLARNEADILAVSKLDRLSRSVPHGAALIERSRAEGWTIVALDMGIDTSTPSGEMISNVMLAMGQFERRLIGQRTRDALAQRRAQGLPMGRPVALAPEVASRIVELRASGLGFGEIARTLNDEGIPTTHKATTWRRATIRAILLRSEDSA